MPDVTPDSLDEEVRRRLEEQHDKTYCHLITYSHPGGFGNVEYQTNWEKPTYETIKAIQDDLSTMHQYNHDEACVVIGIFPLEAS